MIACRFTLSDVFAIGNQSTIVKDLGWLVSPGFPCSTRALPRQTVWKITDAEGYIKISMVQKAIPPAAGIIATLYADGILTGEKIME